MTAHPEGRATLGRRERVIKASTFRAVYAARARAGDGRLAAYAMANGLDTMRLGLSVGKRCGGAVQRNRIKRLLREAFRQARQDLPAGYDIVLVPVARDYTFGELDGRIRALVPEAVRRFQKRQAADAAKAADGAQAGDGAQVADP